MVAAMAKRPRKYWLMKSEPDVYSIDDMEKDGEEEWEGVRNYQARNFMRDMKEGDLVIFYHSNAKPPGAVGVVKVVGELCQRHQEQDRIPRRTTNRPLFEI